MLQYKPFWKDMSFARLGSHLLALPRARHNHKDRESILYFSLTGPRQVTGGAQEGWGKPTAVLQEYKSYVANASSILRKKRIKIQISVWNLTNFQMLQLNQHTIQDTSTWAPSSTDFKASFSPKGGNKRLGNTPILKRKVSFYVEHSPTYRMNIFSSLQEMVKSTPAWGNKAWGRLTADLGWSPLCCTGSCQSLGLATAAWQIARNMNQGSKTNHSVVILYDLHGINLWTIGES